MLLWKGPKSITVLHVQDYFNLQRGGIEAGTERGLSKQLQAEILEWIKKNEKR